MECQHSEDIGSFQISVNVDARMASQRQTVSGLLQDLGLDASRVAIEMNRRIVKRTEWDTLELFPGAKIEIVQFVGGG
jgi:thiamine biosynthesis protein ThiS